MHYAAYIRYFSELRGISEELPYKNGRRKAVKIPLAQIALPTYSLLAHTP